jgi:hypothetical protein
VTRKYSIYVSLYVALSTDTTVASNPGTPIGKQNIIFLVFFAVLGLFSLT